MIEQTLREIQAQIKSSEAGAQKKEEILRLLDKLQEEIQQLSATDREHAESIIRFAQVSAYEAMRKEKMPALQRLSLEGLAASVRGFEDSHPALVQIVNAISTSLANLGV